MVDRYDRELTFCVLNVSDDFGQVGSETHRFDILETRR